MFKTLNVDVIDTGVNSHPSIFQTPQRKGVGCEPPGEGPDDLWLNRIRRRAQTYADGPPMNGRTRCALIESFNDTKEKPMNNRKPTLLFALFFSRDNIALLQKSIRSNVYRWSGIRVGNQSETDLRQAMHNAFERFAKTIDETHLSANAVLTYLKSEVTRLDDIVVEMSTRVIVSNIQALKGYVKFTSQPPTIERPVNTKITGLKSQ